MGTATLMSEFRELAEQSAGRRFEDFEELHRWSVDRPDQFWPTLWHFDEIESPDVSGMVLASDTMPGARWFPGTRLNYARQVFRHVERAHKAGHPAIIAEDESGSVEIVYWPDLRARVASFASSLRSLGVGKGDRVVAYLPNRPEAIVSFLACASIGAIWAICAPDMGIPAILDRFEQIGPKVLIATDGGLYAGSAFDRTDVVTRLRDALPTLEEVVIVQSGYGSRGLRDTLDFEGLVSRDAGASEVFDPEWVNFDHPLWIVYSSGTTGKPKPLVHGHGGMLLGAAASRLHSDLRPSYKEDPFGERFHWFSSTGWMMWNSQVSGLLSGTTICLFDGSPVGSRSAPDLSVLWRFVARNKITFFGSGAQFFTTCERANVDLSRVGDLSSLRTLGSTASPLPAAVQTSLSERLASAGQERVWWFNSSGGTDVCGAFCTGNRELPTRPGKLQCRQLGAAVEAWNEKGEPVLDEVGELVVTRPMPNMPLYLWGDEDNTRYHEAYFAHFSGVWRHGDWLQIEPDGTCEIFGRSDATINRGGHRMGTSEIYAAVESVDEVIDSLAIDARSGNNSSRLLLFVVITKAAGGFAGLSERIRLAVRNSLSPRFLPDEIIPVVEIPRTLSSKKLELPIKRLFEGEPVEAVIEQAAMANPDCLEEYVKLATTYVGRSR